VLDMDYPISELTWTTRTENVLAAAGVKTIHQLYNCDAREIMNWRNSGTTVIRELTVQMAKIGLRPVWLRGVKVEFSADEVSIPVQIGPDWSEGNPELNGYGPVTSAYVKGEGWMLNIALADLEKDGADYKLVAENGGIAIWRKGAKEITD
jgi:hypothetical protein